MKKRKGKPLASRWGIPEACFPGVPYLELQGDSSVAVTGYEGLLAYDDRQILFRMRQNESAGYALLRICGENLMLSVLHEGCVRICGCIHAVILHGEETGT